MSELPPDADLTFWQCNVTVISGGRLQIGSIDQEITQPIKMTWATGFDPITFEGYSVFGPMRAEPQRVKGGVLGIEGTDVIPILQISAQPEMAADPELAPEGQIALRLRLKIKTINPLLGDTCYIGGAKDPIVLNLTFGTTAPRRRTSRSPAPRAPRRGRRHRLDPGRQRVRGAEVVRLRLERHPQRGRRLPRRPSSAVSKNTAIFESYAKFAPTPRYRTAPPDSGPRAVRPAPPRPGRRVQSAVRATRRA